MSTRAIARILSAIVAVLVLLQPYIRMAYSVELSSRSANAIIQIDGDRDSGDREIAIESADRPTEAAAPVRRARIIAETFRDYFAILNVPEILIARLAVPNCERHVQKFGIDLFECFCARTHETRGKPHITASISFTAEWFSEICGKRGFKSCPIFDDSCALQGRFAPYA